MSETKYRNSQALLQRAQRVIPGGVYGHQAPRSFVDGDYPIFLKHAEGCRVVDVDDNRYIDLLCSFGPMIVGYRNAAVEEAASAQRAQIDIGNVPAPVMVELAERLVAMTPGTDWAMFAKNGSDVCTWSLALAREATGRDLIAMVGGTYHGVHGWCNGRERGFPDGDRASIVHFEWNELEQARALFEQYPDRIAGVIVTPFRHEAYANSVLPTPGFLSGLRELCDTNGSVFILDDVRAGFRLHLGGSGQYFGVTPDLCLYSKALSNGRALAAILGRDSLREAASTVFFTGTAFTQAVPMAAALATIDELQRGDAIAHMERVGRRLCQGLVALAAHEGLAVTISGPPAIPFMTFDGDAGGFRRARAFSAAWARNGVFSHPHHNWFVSAAHTDADIDEALAAAKPAFHAVIEAFGSDSGELDNNKETT
ncbi:MAG: glutamate-1-semialdehyde 2,1-aminomutase [Hyphomicrobiaceae bacterium]|jgi:glutamate-1-semialdehyde 2,1-aminomutase